MKILIIDDDLTFGMRLKSLINEKFNNNKVVVKKNFTESDLKQKYDYYFLDIMLDEESGIDCGKRIVDKYYFAKVIYMSSEDKLVFDIFASKVYSFIRKSNLKEDLEKLWVKIAVDNVKNNDYIEIIAERKREIILKKEIVYIESNRNKCLINMKDKQFEVYRTLKSFSKELDSNQYFRINNYTIINLEYVKCFNDRTISLINKKNFILKKNYAEFIEAYHNNYMKRFK